MSKNAFAAGALPQTPRGSLQRSPNPLAGNGGGGPGKGREREKRGWKERGQGRGRKKREGEGLSPRMKILATALVFDGISVNQSIYLGLL